MAVWEQQSSCALTPRLSLLSHISFASQMIPKLVTTANMNRMTTWSGMNIEFPDLGLLILKGFSPGVK